MGALTLPASGPIYLDACGFIYSVERIEPYRALLEPMWRQARAGQFVIMISELSVMETLLKPLRDSDTVLERLFRELLDSSEVRLIPTTRAVGRGSSFAGCDEFEDAGCAPLSGSPVGKVHAVRHQ